MTERGTGPRVPASAAADQGSVVPEGPVRRSVVSYAAAPIVVSVILVLATGFSLVAHGVTARQAQQLLDERATELTSVLGVSISESRSALLVAGKATTIKGAGELLAAATERTTATGGRVVVAERHGEQFRVVASVGPGAAVRGDPVPASTAAILRRARLAKDLTTGVITQGSSRHLIMALTVASSPNRIAYVDNPLAAPSTAPSSAQSPYRELNVAVYATPAERPVDRLILSGSPPERSDRVSRKTFQVGSDTWLLVISSREPLVGSMATAFPWLLFGAASLVAIALGLFIEALQRRRMYALRLVEERTRSLRRAQLAAEFFFATLTHDIRAPLTAIQGFAELLPAVDPPVQEEFIERIQSNVARLGVLIDDVLDHARLRSDTVDLAPTALDAAETVRSCVNDLGPALRSHPVIISPGEVLVQADAAALHRILANLLVNAAKYSPEASPIEVHLDRDETHGRITITDHGRGIAAEDLPTIFDEFERGSQATLDGGSGLGLSSVRHLVTHHQGRVRIESELGVGTTVTVELPLAPGPG